MNPLNKEKKGDLNRSLPVNSDKKMEKFKEILSLEMKLRGATLT